MATKSMKKTVRRKRRERKNPIDSMGIYNDIGLFLLTIDFMKIYRGK